MSWQRHTYPLFKFNRGSLLFGFVSLSSLSLPWLVVECVECCCSLQLGFGGASVVWSALI
ncbi:hypothetical protein GIB67_000427 [Kingdonia uniflora]|uniref:Uncharacterized protein n=1 Tax=Kingdonia uniflora TaxID=39325 RepID=A0A7J7MPY6_9MAGN|nr:hypothetical protein GIB67_000427 [Kingdonia uniflora]